MEETNKPCKHFDVILVSDFSLPGGTTASNLEEIKAHQRAGLRTGLIPLSFYPQSGSSINPKIKRMIDNSSVSLINKHDAAACEVMIIRHPRILQHKQQVPIVTAKRIHLIVNQTPKRDYGKRGETVYDIKLCDHRVAQYFGQRPLWHPIGPQIRSTLETHHSPALQNIELSAEDWINIIDVAEWKRAGRPGASSVIRIGRHARDTYEKWPSDPDELLTIYPDSPNYEIRILGGASIPRKVLGRLPVNWIVTPFGAKSPQQFLKDIDVFVYFIHPRCIEGFGRVIFEAMAAGVPVIVPAQYKPLFGEAALYADPPQVRQKMDELMGDEKKYEAQAARALDFVEERFGYRKHIERLKLRGEF